MDSSILQKLQKTECEMLSDIDEFCRKNDVCYSLAGGNLIGAIRHKGFIPWDDDMDIIMTRNEYDRFLSLWDSFPKKNLYTIEVEGIDSSFGLNHTKICKNGTIFSNAKYMKANRHHGIWIDVFAYDKIPTAKVKRKICLFFARLRILFTRDKEYTEGSKALQVISKIVLYFPPCMRQRIKNLAEKKVRQYKDLKDNFEYAELMAPNLLGMFYPKSIMDQFEYCDYDGYKFMISSSFDTILKIRFGDYLTLPDEKDRVCRHNPEIIEFGDKE